MTSKKTSKIGLDLSDPSAPKTTVRRDRVQKKPVMVAKTQLLDRGMPIQFGDVKATIFGGPFREYVPGQRRLVGVKMAAEIDHPHDISIPTEDYSIPRLVDMHAGIEDSLSAILSGNDIYAGCMGGVGRTGLFMSCMAKIMIDYDSFDTTHIPELGARVWGSKCAPVDYVRATYNSHAVETAGQKTFVEAFDTSAHVAYLKSRLEPKIHYVPKVVEVPVYHFNPFLAIAEWFRSSSR